MYKKTGNYLKNIKLNESELTRAIIGAIGQLDAYTLPDLKGYRNIKRKLTGYTDQKRQEVRDQILSTKSNDFYHLENVLKQLLLVLELLFFVTINQQKLLRIRKETFIL